MYFAVNCSKVISCLFLIRSPMTCIPLPLKCIRPSFIPRGKSGLLCKSMSSERQETSPCVLWTNLHILKLSLVRIRCFFGRSSVEKLVWSALIQVEFVSFKCHSSIKRKWAESRYSLMTGATRPPHLLDSVKKLYLCLGLSFCQIKKNNEAT